MSETSATIISAAPAVCPSCGQGDMESLYTLRGIPVQSTLLVETSAQALAFPTGDLELAWCPACGFAANRLFDPASVDYSTGYEESQAHSPTFMRFARELAGGWIDRYHLRGKKLLEIGCGKGEFLQLMSEQGGCPAVGYDPAFDASRDPGLPGVRFIAENFGGQHVPVDADFILCRHTLEHIPNVGEFLALVRRACAGRGSIRLGFELPDFKRILDESAFWDIYYEHCSYFTAGSLARAFAQAGFEVIDLRHVYGGQYLVIEARPAVGEAGALPDNAHDLPQTAQRIARFRNRALANIEAWRAAFAQWRAGGRRIVLWGSGSKAVGFLTAIGQPEAVHCVVDINPRRHGKYMPGCGMPIVAPDMLREREPDIVIVMNPIYRREIAESIQAMNLAVDMYTVDDPNSFDSLGRIA
jgi:SAM-dependent methyltransferase